MVVSIITPCYNHGKYLEDAIQSVESIKTKYSWEHIIINDGSFDDFTLRKLEELETKGYHIIHQSNQGLATARNNGVAAAKGKYILPLDSDNKLHENYLTTAIDILEKFNDTDVVYGNAFFWGNKSGLQNQGGFDFDSMIFTNSIDACAVIRKSVLEAVGGYDKDMPAMGNEDWDLWINIYQHGGKLFHMNEIGFYYRVLENSMSATITGPGFQENRKYILKKYSQTIIEFYQDQINKANYDTSKTADIAEGGNGASYLFNHVSSRGDETFAGHENRQFARPLDFYKNWQKRMKVLNELEDEGVFIRPEIFDASSVQRKKWLLAHLRTHNFIKKKRNLLKLWLSKKENITFTDFLLS